MTHTATDMVTSRLLDELEQRQAEQSLEPEYQDDFDPAVRDGWQIEGLSSLEWALERMGELAAEIAENNALKLQWIARIEARVAALNRTAQRGVAFFERAVEFYARTHREDLLRGGKKKSRTLPSGVVGWRSKAQRLEVVDQDAYLAWAREQPIESGLVRIKLEPAMKPLQALFATTGEIPPGCEVREAEESLYVEPIVPPLALTRTTNAGEQ